MAALGLEHKDATLLLIQRYLNECSDVQRYIETGIIHLCFEFYFMDDMGYYNISYHKLKTNKTPLKIDHLDTMDGINSYKIAILGDGYVGRNSLVKRFLTDEFYRECFGSSIEDEFRKKIQIDGEYCYLDIFVPVLNSRHGSLDGLRNYSESILAKADGYYLVYSIDNTYSMDYIERIGKYLSDVNGVEMHELNIVLCGNKCDLENKREINRIDGSLLGYKWKSLFFETSAKNRINVINSFNDLTRLIIYRDQKYQMLWNDNVNNKCCNIL